MKLFFFYLLVVFDFMEVYKFIGSVFDLGVFGYFWKFKEMFFIDCEMVSVL